MMGEGGRAARRSAPPAAAAGVVVVVVAEIAVAAAAAAHVVVVVIIAVEVAPVRGRVDGLHRDLGSGLGRSVEGLGPGVVLRPELHGGLHGDLGLLGEAVAAVGGRGAAVTRGRRVIRRRRGAI